MLISRCCQIFHLNVKCHPAATTILPSPPSHIPVIRTPISEALALVSFIFSIEQNSRKEKLQKPISKHRQPPRHAAAYDDTALRIFSVEASLIRLFLKIIEGVGYHHCV
jgi:hypothetical protein